MTRISSLVRSFYGYPFSCVRDSSYRLVSQSPIRPPSVEVVGYLIGYRSSPDSVLHGFQLVG